MRLKIQARDGYMLTNGGTFGSIIWLAEGETSDSYHEITIEEYEKIMAEEDMQDAN